VSRRRLLIVAAFAAVYVIWGSTYLGIRVAIETMPPLLMAGIRFLIAGALLYAVAIRLGDRHRDRPTRRHWKSAAVIGLLLLGLGNGGVTFGEQRVASGVAALLVATVPLWIAVFAHLRGVERMSRLSVAGLIAGFAGVALLLQPGATGSPLSWMLVVLASPVAWSLGTMYARTAEVPRRPLVGTAMEMLCGGAALLVAATLHGEWGRLDLAGVSGRSVLAFAYLCVFGSIVAYTAYIWLVHEVSPASASTYAYVNPLVAVVLGAAFLGEPLGAATVAAAVLIVVAVAVILAARGRAPAAEEAPAEAV
jgi:drug/metabolite transporter (DMT)-like permease